MMSTRSCWAGSSRPTTRTADTIVAVSPHCSSLPKLTASPQRACPEARLDCRERRLHPLLSRGLLRRRRGGRIPQAELTRRTAQAAHAHTDQPYRLLAGPDLLEQPQGRLGDHLWLVGRLW